MIVDDTDMPKTGRKGEMLGRFFSHVDNRGSILVPFPPLAEQERIVSILDRFEALTTDLTAGLPAEIKACQQQYEYYRDTLPSFPRKASNS